MTLRVGIECKLLCCGFVKRDGPKSVACSNSYPGVLTLRVDREMRGLALFGFQGGGIRMEGVVSAADQKVPEGWLIVESDYPELDTPAVFCPDHREDAEALAAKVKREGKDAKPTTKQA